MSAPLFERFALHVLLGVVGARLSLRIAPCGAVVTCGARGRFGALGVGLPVVPECHLLVLFRVVVHAAALHAHAGRRGDCSIRPPPFTINHFVLAVMEAHGPLFVRNGVVVAHRSSSFVSSTRTNLYPRFSACADSMTRRCLLLSASVLPFHRASAAVRARLTRCSFFMRVTSLASILSDVPRSPARLPTTFKRPTLG